MLTPKPRNGVGGWIVLALICAGGSTGGGYLGRQDSHNPGITTEAWIKMTLDVERIDRNLAKLTRTVEEMARRLPQTPP